MGESETRIEKISARKADLGQELADAQQSLADLQARTPRILAEMFIGEMPRDVVDGHKKQIEELRTLISDAIAGLEGLNTLALESRESAGKEARIRAKRMALVRYLELKEKITVLTNSETYDRFLENSFRSVATDAGKLSEAVAILRELTVEREHGKWRAGNRVDDNQPVNPNITS